MNTKRINSIDILKGIAVLSMILIHIPMVLVLPSGQSSTLYQLINMIAYVSAPIFLFFVGFNLNTQYHNNTIQSTSILKRGVLLFCIGFLFSFLWTPDIIHVIGFFLLLSFPLIHLSLRKLYSIAGITLFVSFLLQRLFNYSKGWINIPLEYNHLWVGTGISRHLLFNGVYPLFPWFFIVIAGIITSKHFYNHSNKEKFMKKTMVLGVLLVGIATILHTSLVSISFYPPSLSYMVGIIGIVLWIFAYIYRLCDLKAKKHIIITILQFIGSASLSFYIGHILFGLSYFLLTDKLNIFPITIIMIYTSIITLLLGIIFVLYKQRYNYAPIEHIIRKI